ncbi:MAG: sigma-70 family RNA polymerase sigma factor [Prevotellaceae bacterium]|jgi:RNA polymerase sigma-70 factor (ECF subfamily)|nr:sigma-70 family RNA polymerase sigma factor [Prevotellaceae bacterium]
MDAENFKRIFLPYHEKLYVIAYGYLGNQSDAEDIVQDTYIKLWHKRGDFDTLLNPESYAVTLLKNSCVDFLRKVRPEQTNIYEISIPADSLISQIENRDQLVFIRDIVERLPAQQKQVIRMKVWDNLSNEEIGELTGLTRGNIKVIISRAKRTIKKLYNKWEKNESEKFA